ncbi:hypothetical protein GO497_24215 [Acidovorax citrulli]|nr:hypothetical protein [Paracidovorax citrulli]
MSAAPWTAEDIAGHHSIAGVQGSPTEELLVCTVERVNRAADRSESSLWCVPLEGGGAVAPDGRHLHGQQSPLVPPMASRWPSSRCVPAAARCS